MTTEEKNENLEGVEIRDHEYDGIQEFDNPMPGWWLWIFYATVAFAPVYMVGVHYFDFIPTYETDLATSQADLEATRAAYADANPTSTFDENMINSYLGIEEHIAAGSDIYTTRCAVCHGDQGQGLIGPNLTDEFWLHGNDTVSIFGVITDGVIAKGMTPWGNILAPEERAQVISFIRSIEGNVVEGAKAPEGERVELDAEQPTE